MIQIMPRITLLEKHKSKVIQFIVLLYAFLLPFGHIFSNILLFLNNYLEMTSSTKTCSYLLSLAVLGEVESIDLSIVQL